MGVPTWEVGYTSAMPRREDHEVRQGHVGRWERKKINKDLLFNVPFTAIKSEAERKFRVEIHSAFGIIPCN